MFYRVVVQAILLYGSFTWVIFAEMEKEVEGANTSFLRQITGKRARRIGDGTWEMPGVEVVREAAGTQLVITHIERHQ